MEKYNFPCFPGFPDFTYFPHFPFNYSIIHNSQFVK